MIGKKTIKVAFADHYKLMREGVKEYLLKSDFTVTLEVSNGNDLLNQLTGQNCPDICLVEMHLKNADYETINLLKINWPDIKIVVYSLERGLPINQRLLMAADAVLPKDISLSELQETLAEISEQTPVLIS